MKPAEVLDAHRDLMNRFDNPMFVQILAMQVSASKGRLGSPKDRKAAVQTVAKWQEPLKDAHCYRVTHDMCALVQRAAGLLNDDDKWDHALSPSHHGLVRFESPLPVRDARGRVMKMNWLVWGEATTLQDRKHGTIMVGFNDSNDPDEMADAIREEEKADFETYLNIIGRWDFLGALFSENGSPLGAMTIDPDEEYVAIIENDGDKPYPATNPVRYLHALWLLLGQTVTDVITEEVDRHTRKRAAKAGLPQRVVVVQLRQRRVVHRETTGTVNWTHRWTVTGHWRWQPHGTRRHEHVYGSPQKVDTAYVRRCTADGCTGRLEKTWIDEYVKGPDGLELFVSDKVYDVRR